MVCKLSTVALAGALVMMAAPASAAILTLPIIGDIEHPDMDPFHVLTPPPPAAPEPAAAEKPMMKHHHHHKMKKKKM